MENPNLLLPESPCIIHPYTYNLSHMDIIAHEERLVASGFKLEQAREILRVVTSGDAQAMTKADGERVEQSLRAELKYLEDRVDARFTKLDTKLDTLGSKFVATAWTVGGVAVGILSAIKYLG